MFAVLFPMTRSFPKTPVHNGGSYNFNIAVCLLALADILNQASINKIAFIVPKNRTGGVFGLKVEQIHFLAKLSVVALFGFFKHC